MPIAECKESQFLQLAMQGGCSWKVLAQKSFWWTGLIFCNFNNPKNFTCWSGKIRAEFTCLIAKSTSPRISDSTFFACCNNDLLDWKNKNMIVIINLRPFSALLTFCIYFVNNSSIAALEILLRLTVRWVTCEQAILWDEWVNESTNQLHNTCHNSQSVSCFHLFHSTVFVLFAVQDQGPSRADLKVQCLIQPRKLFKLGCTWGYISP